MGWRNEQCKKVCRIIDNYLANRPTERDSLIAAVQKAFDALKQSKWTLCNDCMPEEHEWIGTKMLGTTISNEVFVTFETSDGQRFADHISFQNGKLSRSDEHRMRVVYNGAKPIAWKPLPEPYQEGGEADE